MSIGCNIITISSLDCHLLFLDGSGNVIYDLVLGEQTTVTYSANLLTISDATSTAIVSISQLPLINGGFFATFSALETYVRAESDLCVCPCPTGGSETTATMGALIDSAIEKNPLVDADMFAIRDSVSGLLQKFSWLNLKSKFIDGILTGYVSGAGVISAADSIKTAIQKLNGNIAAFVGGVSSVFGRTGAVIAQSGDYIVTDITGAEATANKGASNGYVGMTLFNINFKNVLNTFTSLLSNSNTGVRTYQFQDRNGVIADTADTENKRTFSRTIVGDANYNVLFSDDYVTTSVAFTAARTWTLPSFSVFAGEEVIISDDFQTITSVNTLTIAVQFGKSLNGVINGTEVMNAAGSWRRLCCDGAGNYFFDKGIARLGKTQTFTGTNSFSNAIVANSETANTIAHFDITKSLKSLPLITYPSLNEIAFVKGVTSDIQTQIDGKQATLVSGTNIRPINTNSLLGLSNLRILGAVCGLISATAGAGATLYYSLIGTAAGVAIGSIGARQIPFSANTFQNLSILTSTAQPATGSQVVTIFNNSTATIITLTIAAGSAAGTYSDRVNSFNTVNDDRLTIQVINNAATNGATILSYSLNLY